jgi:hypothetical protein
MFGNLRRELSQAGVPEPELTFRVLSAPVVVAGFLPVSGWTLALLAGLMLIVFS